MVEIQKKHVLDWEPLAIRLYPKRKKTHWEIDVLSWFAGWEQRRQELVPDLPSSQMPLEYYVARQWPDDSLTVHVEWLCEESLPAFEEHLRATAKNLKKVVIGEQMEESGLTVPEVQLEFLAIPETPVFFEDGQRVVVPAFEVSRSPVPFALFDRFTQYTGYVTTAEQMRDEWTYRQNDAMPPEGGQAFRCAAVSCVSYVDVTAFCEWAHFRLPREAEWLSAWVLDWEHEYPNDGTLGKRICQRIRESTLAVNGTGPEWTAEYDRVHDMALIRHGPEYLLAQGWRKDPARSWQRTSYYDLVTQFRVCKL